MNKQQVIDTSRTFEEVLMTKDRRATKGAFLVAAVAALIAVLAVLAVIIMLPLKQTALELYTVDRQTGRMEHITQLDKRDISSDEALGRWFTANYVELREGYNYFALQTDYNNVQQFSSPDVNKVYLDIFNSAQAPDKVFQNAANLVTVSIISNPPAADGTIPDGGTVPDKIATLRIKKTIRHIADNAIRDEIWNVRLTYRFLPGKELTDAQREINPLGFTVTSYQSDKELRE